MSSALHHNGHVAELYVAYRLAYEGYSIHWPSTAQSRYDLLLGNEKNEYARVQVKKASWSQSGPYQYLQARIKSRNIGGKLYSADEIDLFAFTDLNKVWIAPIVELEEQTSVCLGSTNPEYKSQTKYDSSKWLLPDINTKEIIKLNDENLGMFRSSFQSR